MEVETRPSGYMSSQDSGLRLALTDIESLSEEERELLRSPPDQRLTQTKNSLTNGPDLDEDELLRDDPVIQKCSVVEVVCNGTDSIPGDNEVFRTKGDESESSQKGDVGDLGSEKKEVCISEDRSDSSETLVPSNALVSSSAQEVSEDDVKVNGEVVSNVIVEEPGEIEGCTLDNAEQPEEVTCKDYDGPHGVTSESVEDDSNVADSPPGDYVFNIDLDDTGSSECPVVIAATTLPVPLEELNEIELNVESPAGDEISEAAGGSDAPGDELEAVTNDGAGPNESDEVTDFEKGELGLVVNEGSEAEPKASADEDETKNGDIDDNEIEERTADEGGDEPKVTADDESEPKDAADDSDKDKEPADDGDEDKEPADDGDEDKEPAEMEESIGPDLQDDNTMDHMIPRDPMDLDQDDEGDGSPEYRGMTDDILPIIESELDDQPPEGEGVFDTEVEDGGALLDDVEEMQEGSVDIAENEVSTGVEEEFDDGITIEEPETVEDTRKKLLAKFSSEGRRKMKRRASMDSATPLDTPPQKKLKRQSSLEGLNECASGFDAEKFLKEVKSAGEKHDEKAVESADFETKSLESKEPQTIESTKVCLSPSKSTDTLCIDLDGDDDKPLVKIPEPKNDEIDDEKKLEDEKYTPLSKRICGGPALDALFNGKKEITLNRKMFTRILKSYVSQYVLTLGSMGKATRISLKGEDAINKMTTGIASFEKQRDDYKAIVKKLIEDREASKQWDETLIPPKMTRSVGLQVCTIGSINVKDAVKQPTLPLRQVQHRNVLPNPNIAMLAQKQAYAMQQKVQAEQQRRKAKEQLENVNSRPAGVAKKSTGGRPLNNASLAPGGVTATPRLNGLSNSTTISRSSQLTANRTSSPLQSVPQQVSKPPNATVSTNSKMISIGGKNVTVKSPIKPPIKTTLNPVLQRALMNATQPQRSPAGTVVIPRQTPNATTQQQPNRTQASGPGRPTPTKSQTPQNILGSPSTPQQKKTGPAEATIDLTDDDVSGSQSSRALNSVIKRTAQPSPGNITKILPSNMKQRKHPPLPPNIPCIPPRQSPPRPYLGICNTQQGTQGIMLTWHFNSVLPLRKILKFQVFAYQESKGTPDESWKKVGDVDALPLPMACTLTQFREGYTYHFIVRAVDDVGTIGPFSAPNTITLMKKSS